ncbi:unnamed protein product [Polarella glacialis]|uniref:Uncharacterized protein n=1 Tax=Polarella glacialis TaxID=89957 RepID=A0A813HH56_POLGL|nr:unnamed protein product [Polarella glacialis]
MNLAGNNMNHPERIGKDSHTPGSTLPTSFYMNAVGYLPDGTPLNMAGNNVNHPERIGPDMHKNGSPLPPPLKGYVNDIGYTPDGTPMNKAGNLSVKKLLGSSSQAFVSTPATAASASPNLRASSAVSQTQQPAASSAPASSAVPVIACGGLAAAALAGQRASRRQNRSSALPTVVPVQSSVQRRALDQSNSPKYAHVQALLQMNVNAVVDRVQFHKPECPSDSSPWNATLYFQSTADGISARHMLLFELTEYYKTSTGAAATVSMGFDRYTDRALTKELAEWVELPAKGRSKGKGKGDTSSSSGPKRRSPEHGDGSRGVDALVYYIVHGEAVVDAAESHVEEGGGSPSARQVELTGLLVAQRKSEQFHIARGGAESDERLIRLRRRIKETEEELAGGRVGRRLAHHNPCTSADDPNEMIARGKYVLSQFGPLGENCGSFGHKDGPKPGAISCRQGEESWKEWKAGKFGDVSLSDGIIEFAKTHEELKGAFLTFQKDADQIYPGWKEKLGYTGESSVQAATFDWAKKAAAAPYIGGWVYAKTPNLEGTYWNEVGYCPDGTAMNLAGNNMNHLERIGKDSHTPGSTLPTSFYMNAVGYLPDGTPLNMAGNNVNHPERIGKDSHTPGSTLPTCFYMNAVGYLPDGTPLDCS